MNITTVPAQRASTRSRSARVEVARYVTGSAIWAPSVHNTQPWWFVIDGAEIELHADIRRLLCVADPGGREMLMSCGAALFTAKLALRALGFVPESRVLPDPADPHLIARLRWRRKAPPAGYEQLLADQVTRRRTHRGGFGPAPLPSGLLGVLRQGAARDGAALRVASDDASRALLAALVETGERTQRLDSAYVSELAEWTPPPGSMRPDGVSPSSYPARLEHTSPHFPGRDFAHGHGWGLPTAGRGPNKYAGVACVLTTPADRPADWVNAGHALQRILLTAASYGAAAALHSQPTEIDWLRDAIRGQIGDGSYPQLVLRLGTVIQSAVSRRRPLSSVLHYSAEVRGERDLRP
jgi:hypothetical protein